MSRGGALSRLVIRQLGDRWQLAEPLIYYTSTNKPIYVPKGFATDLDSVPRIPVIHSVVKGRAVASAAIHDWLYHKRITRAEADWVFLDAMRTEGIEKGYRWIIYAGVRLFGWAAYRRRRGTRH